jgi:hypothetical protein
MGANLQKDAGVSEQAGRLFFQEDEESQAHGDNTELDRARSTIDASKQVSDAPAVLLGKEPGAG